MDGSRQKTQQYLAFMQEPGGEVRQHPRAGTEPPVAKRAPQSPAFDDLDQELTRRGPRFCRYADDCNIYVCSRRAGERVMASVSRFLTNKLRLKVNEIKSAVSVIKQIGTHLANSDQLQ